VQSWRRDPVAPSRVSHGRAVSDAHALRDGLLTSIANPKLAVFYVALFPQFVPAGAPVLPSALLMATTIVAPGWAFRSGRTAHRGRGGRRRVLCDVRLTTLANIRSGGTVPIS
jgi:threonine/homoserine/homoserine lactone efflux protein